MPGDDSRLRTSLTLVGVWVNVQLTLVRTNQPETTITRVLSI